MKRINTRQIVLDILMQYGKEGTMLRPLLNAVLDKYGYLDIKDRAFIKKLTEGTVERLIAIDYIIDHVSNRKTDRMQPVILMIIRMAVYQLVFMDHVPDSAAVNEAVRLAHIRHIDGLKGFVNGVLRGVAAYRDEGIVYPDICTEYSCPEWIYDRFVSEHGADKADRMIRMSMGSMPVYIRVNRSLTDIQGMIDALEAEGIGTETVPGGPPCLIRTAAGRLIPGQSESFNKGLYSIQDLSSQSAVYELWKQLEVYINERNIVDINVFDLCAAPGGKTCFMAEWLADRSEKDTGVSGVVNAYDISAQKLERIDENLKRCRLSNVRCEVKDASVYDDAMAGTADAVIADLPCSGLGVIGRKVDIKYRVKQEDIAELCKLQSAILMNAARYLKDGGLLLFSVCTVTREETYGQSEKMAELGLHKVSERLFLQGCDPCDGFYYALFQKKDGIVV